MTKRRPREKVKLEYIKDDTARRVTYKKRVKGILKKSQELSLLCEIPVCTIIYGQYGPAPELWPPVEEEARKVLIEFQNQPEFYRILRTDNQETFSKKSVGKLEEKLRKLQHKNRLMQLENLMADLLNGKPIEQVDMKDVDGLMWVVKDKIRCAQYRIRELENNNNNNNNPNLLSDVGTNGPNPPPNRHPGPWDMQAGPSNQPMV